MPRLLILSATCLSLLCVAACGAASDNVASSAYEAFPGQRGIVKRGVFHLLGKSVELEYEELDGQPVLDGDILLPPPDGAAQSGAAAGPRAQGSAIHYSWFWPGGVIPFTIDPGLPDQARVWSAIAEWQNQTNVRFVARTSESAFVRFVRGSGCSSSIGRIGGQQDINLADNCDTGSTIHEIGHAVGMFHEQARLDRDSFVTIHWDNIPDDLEHNFRRYIENGYSGTDQGPYDFGSIMHYAWNAFAIDPSRPTITTRAGGVFNTNRVRLSSVDIYAATAMYGQRPEHPCGYLGTNETLYSGQQVRSCNGRVRFIHQWDGNIVLYRNDGRVLWASNTYGQPSHRLVMQLDGNLVLYTPSGPVWSTGTLGNSNAYLGIQDDCNVVIYSNGRPIWSTGTFGCGG